MALKSTIYKINLNVSDMDRGYYAEDALTVEIEKFEVEGRLHRISAVIWVERKGQKAIVIGDKGGTLKEAGRLARLDMEEIFDAKVHLETWVKVREGWSDDERALRSLGFDEGEGGEPV